MSKIAIIGAGELGQALGKVLSHSERELFFWDRDEEKLEKLGLPLLSLPEVTAGADFVFILNNDTVVHETH